MAVGPVLVGGRDSSGGSAQSEGSDVRDRGAGDPGSAARDTKVSSTPSADTAKTGGVQVSGSTAGGVEAAEAAGGVGAAEATGGGVAGPGVADPGVASEGGAETAQPPAVDVPPAPPVESPPAPPVESPPAPPVESPPALARGVADRGGGVADGGYGADCGRCR